MIESSYERKGAQRAHAVITVCDSIADHLRDTYEIARPVVIRNTPSRRELESHGDRDIRTAANIKSDAPLLIYAGKATFNRGLEDCLTALKQCASKPQLVVLGYFDEGFKIDFWQLVRELDLSDRVHHFGPVPSDEVTGYLCSADISIVPIRSATLSYHYALPNKLFESIIAGLPIVGTDIPEVRNMVNRYNCGKLYTEGDATELASAIDTIIADPDLAESYRLGARGAAQELCWEREQEKLHDVYATLKIQ